MFIFNTLIGAVTQWNKMSLKKSFDRQLSETCKDTMYILLSMARQKVEMKNPLSMRRSLIILQREALALANP
jgi:hypothetical protein